MYLVTSPLPMDFQLFLLRHSELLRPLRGWTIHVLVPEPFAKAIRVFGHAAREDLATPIAPSTAEGLQWFFRARQRRQQTPAEPPDERFRFAFLAYRAPRFRALYRRWRQEGDSVIGAAQSAALKDALERPEGRVEFVRLPHRYLHLTSLLGVA